MKKLFRSLFFIFVFLLLLYTFHPFILGGMVRHLIVQDPLAPADLILVLGGDSNGERVNEAVDLYKNGYAKKLLMSGGKLSWQLTYAGWMKKQAVSMGVPARAILIEDKSESTIENAQFSLPIVLKNKIKSVILVTSPVHTLRAKKVFNKLFSKEGIKVMVRPVQKSDFNPDRWWTRHEDTAHVVWEYVSSVLYFLKGF